MSESSIFSLISKNLCFSSYDQYGFSEAHVTADKEAIANPLKIKAKKFDQRAQQALSVSPTALGESEHVQ